MLLKITTKGCRISESSRRHLNQHLKRMILSLPEGRGDLIVLRMILKKDIDKYHPQRTRAGKHKTYADIKPALSFYTGSITFCLKKQRIYAHFKGQTIDECLDLGMRRIFRKLKKYKDTHIPSESEYPSRLSIRGIRGG